MAHVTTQRTYLPTRRKSTGTIATTNDASGSADAGSGSTVPATYGGDLEGVDGDQQVIGIQGIPVTSTAPTDGEVLAYSASAGELVYVAAGASTGQGGNTTAYGEVPGGAINGSNVTFTLANAPDPATSLVLELNGLCLIQGTDYTLSGSTITMASAPIGANMPPGAPADYLYAREYVYSGPGTAVYGEIPTGMVNGSNTTFTLANTPNPAGSLDLELNGLDQLQGVDFTLSGATITMASPPVGANQPAGVPADILYARFYAY